MFHIAQSTRKRSTLLIGPFGISLLLENLTPRTHVRDVEGCDDVYVPHCYRMLFVSRRLYLAPNSVGTRWSKVGRLIVSKLNRSSDDHSHCYNPRVLLQRLPDSLAPRILNVTPQRQWSEDWRWLVAKTWSPCRFVRRRHGRRRFRHRQLHPIQ